MKLKMLLYVLPKIKGRKRFDVPMSKILSILTCALMEYVYKFIYLQTHLQRTPE